MALLFLGGAYARVYIIGIGAEKGRIILFVEILLEGFKFAAPKQTAIPPGAQETRAIADELHIGGCHGAQTYPQAAFLARGIDKDDEREECQRQEAPSVKTFARRWTSLSVPGWRLVR